jgi:DNA adenine methylase
MPVNTEYYYELRDLRVPRTPIGQALRFLFLNRTCFAGLFRVNRAGSFNVPFGGGQRTPGSLVRRRLLTAASDALRSASIRVADFEEVMNEATEGDVIYCDPTYTVAHNSNSFRRYNERVFPWEDQERLARCAASAARRGATVLVSNAHHRSVRKLYRTAPAITMHRHSCVAAAVSRRRVAREYLFLVAPH